MEVNQIIVGLDAEIARLQKARAALTAQNPPSNKRKKRRLSKEGRARIVAALKKRWAAKKKAKG